RILVQELQVRMSRRAVQVEVVLLDVLPVVALGVGQPEHPLLQDRVAAVPQCQRETQPLPVVAHAGDAVLAPPVRPATRLIGGEVRPGVPAAAVVLPDPAPLPLAQVRPPLAPRPPRLVGLVQPPPLRTRCHGSPLRASARVTVDELAGLLQRGAPWSCSTLCADHGAAAHRGGRNRAVEPPSRRIRRAVAPPRSPLTPTPPHRTPP